MSLRRITVMLNRSAGAANGDDVASRITALFDAVGIAARVEVLEAGAAGPAIARAAADPADAVVAGGGDGTVSSVASALAGTEIPLGVLPLGTLNHFAKDLGIPLELEPAVAVIAAGHAARIDVGQVNGRTFVNNSSIGIYPSVVAERETLRKQGYRKWIAFGLATIKILRHHRGMVVRLTEGGAVRTSVTPFVFVGNNEYDMDGLDLGGRKRLDAGYLVGYLAPRLRSRDLPKLLALALIGRARDRGALQSFATRELEIDTPGRARVTVAVDGEIVEMNTPLRYRALPQSLNVLVPAPAG